MSLHGFLRVLEFRDTLLAALHDDGFADVDSESSNPLVIKNFEDSILYETMSDTWAYVAV